MSSKPCTSAASEACKYRDCTKPPAFEQVVLVRPNGDTGKLCGPYCEEHRDMLRGNLKPTYTGGGEAYRLVPRDLRNYLGMDKIR